MNKILKGYCLNSGINTPKIGQPWLGYPTEVWVLKTMDDALKMCAGTDSWREICFVSGVVNDLRKENGRFYTNEPYNLMVKEIFPQYVPTVSIGQKVIEWAKKNAVDFAALNKKVLKR